MFFRVSSFLGEVVKLPFLGREGVKGKNKGLATRNYGVELLLLF